ncbi:MAG: 2-dehydro-3-deoxy-6-phosphogalactonate aldolase [Micropepsaceae bacterium]
MANKLSDALHDLPLIAILRGLVPQRAAGTASVLVEQGFRAIEVPLNGPGALEAIHSVRAKVPTHIAVGAGTVLSRTQAQEAKKAEAEYLVMPNLDADVMHAGRDLGLSLMPGVFTPSEAFMALSLGAFALKLFPADALGCAWLKALRSVLPQSQAIIYPVSGIDAGSMRQWVEAGADGFGVGSSLFKPEFSDQEIALRASTLVSTCKQLLRKKP